MEEGLCVLWRDLVAATDARDLRALAVRALSDAVRATRWRGAPLPSAWLGRVP